MDTRLKTAMAAHHWVVIERDKLRLENMALREAFERIAELEAAQRWIPCAENPADGTVAIVYVPESAEEYADIRIDCWEDDRWVSHSESYEHYMIVGGAAAVPGETCTGPSEDAPYSHWMALPTPPEQGE
jgi:hypothetical protein